MNTVLLITITVTVALVYGYNSRPCEVNYDNNAYNKFVWKHIIHETFNRLSEDEWSGYLSRNDLCRRSNPQTFMEERDQKNVLRICNGRGRQLHPGRSNLCISDSHIRVYHVYVDWDCKVVQLETYRHYVIVACDKIGNRCLPVHYEPYEGQYPGANDPVCRP